MYLMALLLLGGGPRERECGITMWCVVLVRLKEEGGKEKGEKECSISNYGKVEKQKNR